MGLEEKHDVIRDLISKTFKIISNNNANERLYQQKLLELRRTFDAKKRHYTDQIRKSERYDLEYMFLLEQYNLSRLVIEAKIREINMHTKRLEMFDRHLLSRKGKTTDIRNSFYGFNDAIQKELIDKYDTRIQILKQRKILSDRFEKYLKVLKENYPSDYQEKKGYSMSDEELMDIIERKELLREEESITKIELGKRFAVLSERTIMSMELTDPDVMIVAQKMYPNLKDRILELNESRNEMKKQAM